MDGNKVSVLAIDLGASSGRGIVFTSDGKAVEYTEVHRFDNNCIKKGDKLLWDIDMIYSNVVTALCECAKRGIHIDSIGIDTWGVDYGIIDADGKLKAQPYCYRDTRTKGAIEREELFTNRELFDIAGISLNEFNTSYQLIAEQKHHGIVKGDKVLYIPYLLAYMLTGKMACDETFASTSQIYGKNGYNKAFLDRIDMTSDNFADVVPIGSKIGPIKRDILLSVGIDYDIDVIVTCGHDTASAIMTVMGDIEHPLYLSSGTWSLFGTLVDEPIINDVTYSEGYTNERGFGGQITLLKNIMGMWIVQECRREWNKTRHLSWQDIQDAAKIATPFTGFINVGDGIFNAPLGMDKRIVDYVEKTQKIKISGLNDIARCIYNSLALEYRYALDGIKKITGKSYDTLYIIGGGTQNDLLNQLVSDCLDINVVGGCVEATAIGNALAQFYGLKVVNNLQEMQSLSRLCYTPKTYTPSCDRSIWDEMYKRYLSLK